MPTNFSVQAGGPPAVIQLIPLPSGSVFDTPADLALTASDAAVQITPNPGDTTGTEFAVTVPASDTNTTFTLNATGLAGGVQITGSQVMTIIPAVTPPTPATSIGFQQLS